MSSYQTRRATVDDLPQLGELWRTGHLPAAELEKQFTDFQVAQDDQGKLAAAIGLRIEGGSGRVHSETLVDFALTETLRPALWKRLQTVAQNHGLFRLWTEEAAPWWKKDAGFAAPSAELLQKLPAKFGATQGAWLTLRLRDEGADPDLLEKELEMFKEAERQKRETMIQQGKILRVVATLISGLLLVLGLIVLFFVMKPRR